MRCILSCTATDNLNPETVERVRMRRCLAAIFIVPNVLKLFPTSDDPQLEGNSKKMSEHGVSNVLGFSWLINDARDETQLILNV
jgi:hypothetical protein